MTTALTITALAFTGWTIAAVALCWSAHRARLAATPTPPPPDDPDSTADDFDDDIVRIDTLPPVPLPAYWSESDDAMVAWFCAGRADR